MLEQSYKCFRFFEMLTNFSFTAAVDRFIEKKGYADITDSSMQLQHPSKRLVLLFLSVPTLDLYHIQQKIIKQKNYPQLFRENFQRSYLHLCMRNARRGSTLPAHRRRQCCAHWERQLGQRAQRTRAVRATVRRAPLQWDSSGLDKAFSAQPGQATLSSHTYTLQG